MAAKDGSTTDFMVAEDDSPAGAPTDAQLDAMLSAALSVIDYDIWKDLFAEPDCGYAEDPEEARADLAEARDAMREALLSMRSKS